MVDAVEQSAARHDAALIDAGGGLVLAHGLDEEQHALDNLFVGVGGEVVGAEEEEDLVGAVAVQLAVHDAPEAVLDAVEAEAEVVGDAPLEEAVPAGAVVLGVGAGAVVGPVVGDGVAYHDYLGCLEAVGLEDMLMTLLPDVGVALLGAGGEERIEN